MIFYQFHLSDKCFIACESWWQGKEWVNGLSTRVIKMEELDIVTKSQSSKNNLFQCPPDIKKKLNSSLHKNSFVVI